MSHGRACWLARPLAPLLVVLLLIAISACGSRQTPQAPVTVDEEFTLTSHAAGTAFGKGAYARAADLYRQALARAYARDDRAAIVDMQCNLAVVLLRLGSLEEARAAVDDAKAELARAAQGVPAHLLLLEATVLYRTGQMAAAWDISEQLLAGAAEAEAGVMAKAQFLRGLLAAERGDEARLREAIAALAKANDPALRADHAELRGYLAMAEHHWEEAVQAFDATAELRRESLDYVSMIRALVRAGDASERRGRQRAAAVYYLRAGRSASQLGRQPEAVHWLMRAQVLARQAGDARTLQAVLAHLARLQEREPGQGR
jgi:tetratricopeptide (TPR) repeat protein